MFSACLSNSNISKHALLSTRHLFNFTVNVFRMINIKVVYDIKSNKQTINFKLFPQVD